MEKEEKLTLQFDPGTIEALGIKMYSQIPHALAELIANAWDAAAKKVMIHLEDDAERKIIVIDDGDGMSFTEVQDKFLRIGRHRRSDEERTNSLGRKITGKKGLGKLALFGI
ncbi:MAG: ATP-binding protein, partial [Streptococcaceae bacterium]|nr:ATP-binding protein [Streptococcaceae bacterium]